jgi:hypothetical protein
MERREIDRLMHKDSLPMTSSLVGRNIVSRSFVVERVFRCSQDQAEDRCKKNMECQQIWLNRRKRH